MFLLVGLGNDDVRYMHTRHNLGFLVLDAFCAKHKLQFSKERFHASVAQGHVLGQTLVLLKPKTMMNLSGISVAEAVRFYGLEAQQFAVVYDDIDLPLGQIRVRLSGGPGSHNGMKSVIAETGTQAFTRVRAGIGGNRGEMDLKDYVLARFSPAEQPLLEKSIAQCVHALELIVDGKGVQAMNTCNHKGVGGEAHG